jgi:hypothetical protein
VRYFYDLEFHEDGVTVDLVSVGIAAEDGREYYAVNAGADWSRIRHHAWLMANVEPHLPDAAQNLIRGGAPAPKSHPVLKPKWQIATEVSQFIRDGGSDNRDDHDLIAFYGAYDHVGLCQLWGRMIDLPPWVPMFTHDLRSMSQGLEQVGFAPVRPDHDVEHNALADARWNMAFWRAQVEATQRFLDTLRGVPDGSVLIKAPTAARLIERMLSEGPNEGISLQEEADLRGWWEGYVYPPGEPEAGGWPDEDEPVLKAADDGGVAPE